MAAIVDSVRSVLIPLNDTQLILPNAAVAEIAPWQQPQRDDSLPDWHLGMVPWRAHSIPLISMELLRGHGLPTIGRRTRVAVCNTVSGSRQLDFIGILATDIPRLIRVDEDSINAGSGSEEASPGVLRHVEIYGDEALIPDLDALEMMLATN